MRMRSREDSNPYIFYEDFEYVYCVYDNGSVTKTSKRTLYESSVKRENVNGIMKVRIDGKYITVKRLVAMSFCPHYKKGNVIVCKDEDERNLDIANLELHEAGYEPQYEKSARVEVIYPNGKRVLFKKMKEVAKTLNIDETLFSRILKSGESEKILNGIKVQKLNKTV